MDVNGRVPLGGLGILRRQLLGPGQLTWKGKNCGAGYETREAATGVAPVCYLPDFVESSNKYDIIVFNFGENDPMNGCLA